MRNTLEICIESLQGNKLGDHLAQTFRKKQIEVAMVLVYEGKEDGPCEGQKDKQTITFQFDRTQDMPSKEEIVELTKGHAYKRITAWGNDGEHDPKGPSYDLGR